jgi:cell division protein FtsB
VNQRKHQSRWKGALLRILLAGFVVWLLFFDSSSIRKMVRLQNKATEMKARYDRQAARNDSLREQNRKKETDPLEWEKEARAAGMQKSGEQVIRVIRQKP